MEVGRATSSSRHAKNRQAAAILLRVENHHTGFNQHQPKRQFFAPRIKFFWGFWDEAPIRDSWTTDLGKKTARISEVGGPVNTDGTADREESPRINQKPECRLKNRAKSSPLKLKSAQDPSLWRELGRCKKGERVRQRKEREDRTENRSRAETGEEGEEAP